jgi:putative nucleotidyltransferase with HDIG domain
MAPLHNEIAEYLHYDLAPEQPRLSILKLAALLHDIGKPATRSEERGRIRFLDHPDAGARMAGEALTRLRYSAAAVRMAATLVREHMRLLSLLSVGEASNRALYRFHQSLGDASAAAGMLFLADLAATRPLDTEPRWTVAQAIVVRVMQACLAEPQVVDPTPLVDGRDLIEALGVGEGPVVGYLIHAVREEQAAGSVRTREEALAFASRALKRWKRARDENR